MTAFKALPQALAAAALAGCAAVPFDYHSQREIPRGPGMFSGEEGAFVLRAKEPRAAQPNESQDYREFQRRDEAGKETAEQREFREWREWREWRKQHGPN
jgi:hypothetical protein